MSSATHDAKGAPELLTPRDFADVVENLERLGLSPSPTRNGVIARCPCHDDTSPSLLVYERNTRDLCFAQCLAGCDYHEIRAALGLVRVDAPPTLLESYEYRDANGATRYVVERYEPKDFRQKRLADDGTWQPNLDGVTSIPYRLPEMLRAIGGGQTVYIVEGEKDANELVRAGLCATTSSGGAGIEWADNFAQWFRGASKLVVIADNDKAGRDAARQRAALLTSKCEDVRLVLELPVPRKGDVSDFLATRDAAALVALCDASENVALDDAVCTAEFQLADLPPVEFDVEQLLTRDEGPSWFYGNSETLKTWAQLHIARCLATGEPVFGKFATKKRPHVALFNFDAGHAAYRRRVQKVLGKLGPVVPNLHVVEWDAFDFERFTRYVYKHRGGWFGVDCWTNVFEFDAEGDQAKEMRGAIEPYRRLYDECDANGSIIDHAKRTSARGTNDPRETYYGSNQKRAAIRGGMFEMRLHESEPREPKARRVLFTMNKPGEAEPVEPFVVEINLNAAPFASFTFIGWARDLERDDADARAQRDATTLRAALASAEQKTLSAPALASAADVGARTSKRFAAALAALLSNRWATLHERGTRCSYTWAEDPPEEF